MDVAGLPPLLTIGCSLLPLHGLVPSDGLLNRMLTAIIKVAALCTEVAACLRV